MFTRLNRWFSSRTQTRRARPLVELLEDRLAPAVLTVNSLDDNTNQDGVLSLREAVGLINGGGLGGLGRSLTSQETAQVNATESFGTNDTIRFAPLLNRSTISITAAGGGRLALTRSMQIVGPALGVTLSGAQLNSILRVESGVTVGLTNLTLQDGRSSSFGGAIVNDGILTITSCRLTNNESAAGGAIFNLGTLKLFSTTFDSNRAVGTAVGVGRGGAVANNRTLTVVNCTFVDNTATGDGGGIFTYPNASTSLNNSIVAGNLKATTPNDLGTPLVSNNVNGGFNLIGNADTAGGLSHGGNGNNVGIEGFGTRPIGNVFALEYGKVQFFDTDAPTLTYRLEAGGVNLVVDASDNALAAGIAREQRGLPRISGSKVDIGALEKTQQAGPYVVDASHDEVNPGDGQLSLREALLLANDHAGDDGITVAASVPAVLLTNGTLRVREGVTITGSGVRVERGAALDVPAFSIFTIAVSGVTLDGLTIANGRAENGGGIYVDPNVKPTAGIDLTIRNCQIVGNTAAEMAGGSGSQRLRFTSPSTHRSSARPSRETRQG